VYFAVCLAIVCCIFVVTLSRDIGAGVEMAVEDGFSNHSHVLYAFTCGNALTSRSGQFNRRRVRDARIGVVERVTDRIQGQYWFCVLVCCSWRVSMHVVVVVVVVLEHRFVLRKEKKGKRAETNR